MAARERRRRAAAVPPPLLRADGGGAGAALRRDFWASYSAEVRPVHNGVDGTTGPMAAELIDSPQVRAHPRPHPRPPSLQSADESAGLGPTLRQLVGADAPFAAMPRTPSSSGRSGLSHADIEAAVYRQAAADILSSAPLLTQHTTEAMWAEALLCRGRRRNLSPAV
eukprot:TRINITY_DN29944_c0_g1_i1.p1 TRINITY_DN29944_c0_g1~~TRINITY_DN29944_c0_g1_i1.p1  ORF type:complete len:181 (+),score=68.05 TRINITY_DN29944_c0_g1_i1:43-543(+)